MKVTPSLKILIVDDSSDSLTLIKTILSKKGFKEIYAVKNGKSAIEVLERQHNLNAPIQIVLSDWEMPELSGKELLAFIRSSENFFHLPFIMITANNDLEHVSAAIDLGVNNYIVKPINYDIVVEKMISVLRSHKD